ncbi:hypothetical protein PybrP1_000739 [[Pythium] brassicae (nom. inval.)]|nr:hypothetical protein PybrP1_000739 [[Pythium] brassicae (nom. inval.)]
MVTGRREVNAVSPSRSRSTRSLRPPTQFDEFGDSTQPRPRKRSHSQNQIRRDVGRAVQSQNFASGTRTSVLRLRELPFPAPVVSKWAKRGVHEPLEAEATATLKTKPPTVEHARVPRQETKVEFKHHGGNQDHLRALDCLGPFDFANDNNQVDDNEALEVAATADEEPTPRSPSWKPAESEYTPRLAMVDRTGNRDSCLLSFLSMQSPGSAPLKWTYTERICDEILTTERAYVRDLETLLRHFFVPLQEYALKYTIPLGSVSALQASIRTIVHIHNDLLQQLVGTPPSGTRMHESVQVLGSVGGSWCNGGHLAAANEGDVVPLWGGSSVVKAQPQSPTRVEAKPPSVEVVVAAFDFTIEFMKVYAHYCSSYLQARDELELLQKTYSGLNALATKLDEDARRDLRVDIVSLMIKPVQRICRYPLLFRELRSHAGSETESERVEKSLRKIEDVSAHVNEKVRGAQNNARLYELYHMIDPKAKINLLQPSRTLLTEMVARVVCLDTPCWATFLQRLGRKDWGAQQRGAVLRSGDSFSSSSGHGSVLDASSPLLLNPRSRQSLASPRTSSQTSSPSRPQLLRRRSSGEKQRLILLSDVLLMARKQEGKLKVKRQLCLSCAHATADDSAGLSARHPWSFVVEVAKVGRCCCHHLSPATLKRAPQHRGSLSTTNRQLGDTHSRLPAQEPPADGHTRPSAQPSGPLKQPMQRTGSRLGELLRNSELACALRPTKRFVVICSTEQQRTEFLETLKSAIARSARVPAKLPGSSLSSVSGAAKFSAKLWRALTPRRLWAQYCDGTAPDEECGDQPTRTRTESNASRGAPARTTKSPFFSARPRSGL